MFKTPMYEVFIGGGIACAVLLLFWALNKIVDWAIGDGASENGYACPNCGSPKRIHICERD